MRNKSKFRKAVVLLLLAMSSAFPSFSYAFFDHAREFDFSSTTPGHELGCMALNIYHEGRGESVKGQAAIAAVTMNRVDSKHYPDTVCEVVWQHKQFSWTHIAARHHAITDVKAWKQAIGIAQMFLNGAQAASVGNATHYHADGVEPYWIVENEPIGKVGNHYFYIL